MTGDLLDRLRRALEAERRERRRWVARILADYQRRARQRASDALRRSRLGLGAPVHPGLAAPGDHRG